MSVKNVRGAYCRPVQQGTCWYSIRIEGFEKVGNANGPPWPEVASRKLIDARSVLRDLVFEMDTIVIEMDPKAFGLFRLTVSFTDKDDGRGGNNTAVQQVWLEVKAVAIPPSINMPSAKISTILGTPTLVPPPPSSTPSESTAASSASQGGDGTSSSPPLYDALTARDEEEFDQAMIQAKFMADLRELPLGNLSALNLMVVEMKEALVQHYPDFLDVTSGSPEQMSVTDLTSTITNLSSSHLFAGGTPAVYGAFPEPTTRCVDVSQAPECAGGDLSKASCLKLVAGCNAKRLLVNQSCSGCPVLGVDGRPGSLSFTLAPYRYGIASMTVRFESRSRLSSLASVVSTYKLDIVVLPVNDPPSADVTPFLGLAQGAEEVVIPFFVTNISVGPENEVWQKAVFHVQSEVDTPGLLTQMPEIDERGTLAMRLWPSMHGRIRMRVMLSDTGGIAYGGRNSSSKFPVTAEIKVFALPTIVSVSPCVGTAGGGWTITIRGNFFGSAYTTEGKADNDAAQISGAVRVHVGMQPCKNTRFVSDTLLVCDVPRGVRRREVQVTVPGGQSFNPQGRLLSSWSDRRGMYVPGVVAAHIYVAGSAGGAKSAVYPWPQTPADIEGKKEERVCSVCRARIALVDISTNTTSNASNVTNASDVTPPKPVGRTRLTSWIPFCNWTNTSVRTGNKTSWETRLTLDAVQQISEYLGLGASLNSDSLDMSNNSGLLMQQLNEADASWWCSVCQSNWIQKYKCTIPNTNATSENSTVRRAPGGAWLDGGGQGGFVGLGPDIDDPVAWDGNVGSVPASLSLMPNLAAHVLSRSVRAIAVFPPHVVLGGSFLGHLTNRLDYLVRWDGAKVEGIGGGLDGTVYALETVRNFLVVAGSFSQLYQVRLFSPHFSKLVCNIYINTSTAYFHNMHTHSHTHTQTRFYFLGGLSQDTCMSHKLTSRFVLVCRMMQ